MSKTRRPKTKQKKSGSTTVSIGGTSQSAFAGYATGKPVKPQVSQSTNEKPANKQSDKAKKQQD